MKKYLFIVLAIGMIFSSCKRDAKLTIDPAVQHIPADAAQVTVLRIPQLMKKIDFETLRDSDAYQNMIDDAIQADPLMGDILYEPSKSGIDMNQNAYLISDINPSNINEMVNGIMINMGDKEKFSKLIQSSPMKADIQKGDGYEFIAENEGFIAWNDKIAFMGQFSGDVETKLNQIFNLGDGASVLSIPNFEKAGSASDDISFMVNTKAIAENPQTGFFLTMLNWTEPLKEGYISGEVNFDEKKMTSNTDFFFDGAMKADLSMPFKSKVSTDFSPYMPKDVTGAFTFGLDTKGLLQLLKEKNLIGMLNQQGGLDQMGIKLEDIAAAIDGDMMLAIQKEGSDGKPAGIFSLSINEDQFQPFLDQMIQLKMITDEGDGIYQLNDESMAKDFSEALGGGGAANDPKLIIRKGKLFISGDPVLIQGVLDGGLKKGNRIDSGLYKSISSGFLGGKGFPKNLEGIIPNMDKNNVESFVFSIKDGNANMEMVSDKSGNFLKSMIESAQEQN